MSFYPATIHQRLKQRQNAGAIENASACGRSASFLCGCSVGFSVRLGEDGKTIESASFNSNGCGYMIAAADVLAGTITGTRLSDLHSLDHDEVFGVVENALEPFPTERRQCADVCIEALRATFADLRATQIEEFAGEKALVCTCFGVLEETIASHISERSLKTTDEVAAICNAGDGCARAGC
ncbi:MAG: iron-sulfur cluster assembly scaffold protein [Chloracidobacterium sp.]|nr:iron-sulfur cluster assembly scaffold protein [Chloracidobacterium sp.]